MKIFDNNLYLIDLEQKSLRGFRNFISSWVYHSPNLSFVVDPGPLSSIPVLLSALKNIGVNKLDYVLLTHIHIDHAGGTGELIKHFPEAKVICHDKGIPHLISPQKLWQGSLRVLGKVAEAFGPIAAIPEEKISNQNTIETADGIISVLYTPGHAVHHQSYLFNGRLFAGEALGTYIPNTTEFYLRPATPPKFIHEIFDDALNKLSVMEYDEICFAHFGNLSGNRRVAEMLSEQLKRWIRYIGEKIKTAREEPRKIVFNLINDDPLLRSFSELPPDIQDRELYFMENSVRGISAFIENK